MSPETLVFAVSGPQPSCTKDDVENLLQSRRQKASNHSSRKRGLSARDAATDLPVAAVLQEQSSPSQARARQQSPIRDFYPDKAQNAPLSPSSKLLYCTESPGDVFEQTRGSNGPECWRHIFSICSEQGWEPRPVPSHDSPNLDYGPDGAQAGPLSPSTNLLYCTESPSEVFEQTRGPPGPASWQQIRVCTEQGWERRSAPSQDNLPAHQCMAAASRYSIHALPSPSLEQSGGGGSGREEREQGDRQINDQRQGQDGMGAAIDRRR